MSDVPRGPAQQPPGKDPEVAWPDISELVAPESAEQELERALQARRPPLPSTGLLSFYDRLREKILHGVERKGGKYGEAAAEALLLVPDVFILLVRLALDKEVPRGTRALIGGALAYFVMPADLLPEAILGAGGYLEDLVLAAAVLSQAFGGELERYAHKHWSGSHELRKVLHDLTTTGHSLLGENLYARLKRLLARRGVHLEDKTPPPGREE
jgi:uncharacterized membrane protein YkvA (DUF1232 family)